MEPVISLHDVAVSYKRSGNVFRRPSYTDVLKSVSFDIFPGEALGIIGRNGVGKSTLLRLISGVIRPDKGKVINRGVSVSLLALQAGFDPNLNGRDNAVLGGILQGYSRNSVEKHLNKIQDYSELGDFFYEPVRTYSAGMRARLGFSISTIIAPDVLLIDEVLGVGDQLFREKAEKTMLSKIQSDQTIVFVSHSHHQVLRLCDRAIFISDGIVVAAGDTKFVVDEYEKVIHKSNN